MHIENMYTMIESLTECVKTAFETDSDSVGNVPVTEAVDMIRDLNEALYYASVVLAMGSYGTRRGYEEPPYYHMTPEQREEWERNRDMDRATSHRMYFSEPIMRDGKEHMETVKESRYDRARRSYTESKEIHKANTPEDKTAKMKDLEAYVAELSADLTDIVKDMSQEERTLLKNKVTALATKL